MVDENTKKAPRDSRRVNIGEEYELKYWTGKFGCTRYQLEMAVRKVGAMAKEVEKELKAHDS